MPPIPWDHVGNGGIVAALLFLIAAMPYGLFRALLSGTLRTGREVEEKDARIEALTKANSELSEQNRMLLNETIPTITAVLASLREAALGKKRT